MQEINFLESLHTSTKRDYIGRVDRTKPSCCEIAKEFDFHYWDGPRCFGYGGYKYDGRWAPIAYAMASHYGLKPGDRVLDIGCGKGHLLLEFQKMGMRTHGIDISTYAKQTAPYAIIPCISTGNCCKLPYKDASFDFVYSINTFHNLEAPELDKALQEMVRVGKGREWFCVESYRDEKEKFNMLNWQLTCESFHRPGAWKKIAERNGYHGDVGFIFFE